MKFGNLIAQRSQLNPKVYYISRVTGAAYFRRETIAKTVESENSKEYAQCLAAAPLLLERLERARNWLSGVEGISKEMLSQLDEAIFKAKGVI